MGNLVFFVCSSLLWGAVLYEPLLFFHNLLEY